MLDSRVRRVLIALDRFDFEVPSYRIIDPQTCPPGVMGAILLRAKREGFAECHMGNSHIRYWKISEAGRQAIRQ